MKYNAEIRTDINKLNVNKVLQSLVINTNKAVILDAENLNTTKHLIKAGFKKSNIHIPNPFVYDDIIKIHKNTYNLLLNDYLSRVQEKEFDVAFFDFCSTLEGNNEIKPKQDIIKYFKYKCPAHNSVFGATISVRESRSIYKGDCEVITILHSLIETEALKNGYVAHLTPNGYVYHGIYFCFYYIYKLKELRKFESLIRAKRSLKAIKKKFHIPFLLGNN